MKYPKILLDRAAKALADHPDSIVGQYLVSPEETLFIVRLPHTLSESLAAEGLDLMQTAARIVCEAQTGMGTRRAGGGQFKIEVDAEGETNPRDACRATNDETERSHHEEAFPYRSRVERRAGESEPGDGTDDQGPGQRSGA